MSRLYRGLWHVELRTPLALIFVPVWPVPYEQAADYLAAYSDTATSAILRRVPGTRAPWEYRAPYEATDAPKWGEDA